MLRAEITEYYQRGGERERLAVGRGRLEFLRTWDVLVRVLPEAPATIWDVGGATGVYAGPLARAGYRVHLVDPVTEHVAAAAALPDVTAEVGDARALPTGDHTVDAVLLLGPLYHLLERQDRVDAWREAARVVRPNGVVVGATISRFASLCDGLVHNYVSEPPFLRLVEGALADGRHRHTGADSRWFTSAYFHHPDEIAGEVSEAGLELSRRVAVEGPLWLTGDDLDELLADPDRTALFLHLMRTVEDEPTLIGASSHVLAVARPATT